MLSNMNKKNISTVLGISAIACFLAFVLMPLEIKLSYTHAEASQDVKGDFTLIDASKEDMTSGFIGPVQHVKEKTKIVALDEENLATPPSQASLKEDKETIELSVQAILGADKSAVIAAPVDGILIKFPFESGDFFQKDDVLAKFECTAEEAKVQEIAARVRASSHQLKAYERLKKLDAVADIEFIGVKELNSQEKALLKQARVRRNLCTVFAPFDGRINKKMANNHEAIKSGRVLMEISSVEPLKADFLIPSTWLQWLNLGEPVDLHITESGKTYNAEIVRIHGQVDPVTKTIQVVAKLNEYQEELLPGMSGLASLYKPSEHNTTVGFLNLGDEHNGGKE